MLESMKPNDEQRKKLLNDFESLCKQAATSLLESDVLILVTGAGFSADSGLAVYGDVANISAYQSRGLEYGDICQPHWIHKEPELFYGFWGQCFNDYRDCQPHKGYNIIQKWRNDIIMNKNNNNASSSNNNNMDIDSDDDDDSFPDLEEPEDQTARRTIAEEIQERVPAIKKRLRHEFITTKQNFYYAEELQEPESLYHVPEEQIAGAFFAFTSNVDAHHYDFFKAHEIYECHGNIESWQCSYNGNCSSGLWRAPLDHRFVVDNKTMLAPRKVVMNSQRDDESGKNYNKLDDQNESAEDGVVSEGNKVARIGQILGGSRGRRGQNILRHMPQSHNNIHGWNGTETITASRANETASGGVDNNNKESDEQDDVIVVKQNWPKCGQCDRWARPAILMFGDFTFKSDNEQYLRWDAWREALLKVCKKRHEKIRLSNKAAAQQKQQQRVFQGTTSLLLLVRVCVVEIGCGLNVPTCRNESESLLSDIHQNGGKATLIRINPDFPLVAADQQHRRRLNDGEKDASNSDHNVISIMSRGLNAIQKIDEYYQQQKEGKIVSNNNNKERNPILSCLRC